MDAEKCSTGLGELDEFLRGGLPRKRLYLVQGEPGAGKTTLALQFLLEGVRVQERCLYVALSETKDELLQVMESHAWALGSIAVLDLADVEHLVASDEQSTVFVPSGVELHETTQVILKEVERIKPQRLVVDSLTEMRLLSETPLRFRRQMLALKKVFARMGSTTLLLDDMTGAPADVQLDSIAHGVIRLSVLPVGYGKTRRQLMVTKMRGIDFRQGHHDYVIARGGVKMFPRLVAAEHGGDYSREIVATGIADVDRLLGGGLHPGTSTLISGPSGAGKTTLCFQLASVLAQQGRRAIAYVFDENKELLLEREGALGRTIQELTRTGHLRIEQVNPAEISPGELTTHIRQAVEQGQASIVIIDSLNGYLKAMPNEEYLALQLHELLTYLGQQGVISLLILSQTGSVGNLESPIDVSYLADGVIMLRFYELDGEIKKAISVLKKRTGPHQAAIRDFHIDTDGIRLGEPLRHIQGVLTGNGQQGTMARRGE